MGTPRCHRCGYPFEVPVGIEIQVCVNCQGVSWYLDRAFSCYYFDGEVRTSILEFKYHRKFYWRSLLGKGLIEGFRDEFSDISFDALVPVPLHSSKQRDRGFNPIHAIEV